MAKKSIHNFLNLVVHIGFWISLSGLIVLFFDMGFPQNPESRIMLNNAYLFVLAASAGATMARFVLDKTLFKRKAIFFDAFYLLFVFWVVYHQFKPDVIEKQFFTSVYWIWAGIVLSAVREVSNIKLQVKRTHLNPAQLFIISFLMIIFGGTSLLLLPNATYNGITMVDALFTATSAVCITGLTVQDTGSFFTPFGQFIIMMLIQIGGLGVLTFASYFSYFFKGGSSYEAQLAISDLTSSKKLGEVFAALKYILMITFGIELVAGGFIYFSLDSYHFPVFGDRLFFAAFHAISAFCNAGFCTLSDSLHHPWVAHNYALHLVILVTFIIGGLGFPIVANLIGYMRYTVFRITFFAFKKHRHRPWVLNLNSRITLVTTFSLLLVSFFVFYLQEYHAGLSEHRGAGKWMAALFSAATPRSAGFNTINVDLISMPSVLMIMLLMWIGASPQSTGGGIKTSTFAIACLNILSLARGQSKIELFRRELSDVSVRRAFAIITLSVFSMGIGLILLMLFDGEKDIVDLTFECFSAYSTTGLSLGVTPHLSNEGKVVVIVLMFIGRVSMLSIVIAVFRKIKHSNYKYPQEEITIN